MRLFCYFCSVTVSTEVPEDTLVRALLVCPECIQKGEILLPDRVVKKALESIVHKRKVKPQ